MADVIEEVGRASRGAPLSTQQPLIEDDSVRGPSFPERAAEFIGGIAGSGGDSAGESGTGRKRRGRGAGTGSGSGDGGAPVRKAAAPRQTVDVSDNENLTVTVKRYMKWSGDKLAGQYGPQWKFDSSDLNLAGPPVARLVKRMNVIDTQSTLGCALLAVGAVAIVTLPKLIDTLSIAKMRKQIVSSLKPGTDPRVQFDVLRQQVAFNAWVNAQVNDLAAMAAGQGGSVPQPAPDQPAPGPGPGQPMQPPEDVNPQSSPDIEHIYGNGFSAPEV